MENHTEHGSTKKAVFGAPLIMGLSFWLFAFFFLSFCDNKPCSTDEKCCKTEQGEGKCCKDKGSKNNAHEGAEAKTEEAHH